MPECTARSCGPPSGRVAVQFHPDWPFRGGLVIDAIARDGIYRSQFETSISNGGLTAFPGGDRWLWESRLFDGHYDHASPGERPIYGAWDRGRCAQGPARRFGSAFLRLRPDVTSRSTFCFPDSVFGPKLVVGPERLPAVEELADTAQRDDLDDLDDYIEAHVHGGVRLDRDVEAIVLDPCFGTPRSRRQLPARDVSCSGTRASVWRPPILIRATAASSMSSSRGGCWGMS